MKDLFPLKAKVLKREMSCPANEPRIGFYFNLSFESQHLVKKETTDTTC